MDRLAEIGLALALAAGAAAGDRPQLQHDPAHTGHTPDCRQHPFTVRWVRDMVEAGHLAPLLYIYGGIGGTRFAHYYWVGAPELAHALAISRVTWPLERPQPSSVQPGRYFFFSRALASGQSGTTPFLPS